MMRIIRIISLFIILINAWVLNGAKKPTLQPEVVNNFLYEHMTFSFFKILASHVLHIGNKIGKRAAEKTVTVQSKWKGGPKTKAQFVSEAASMKGVGADAKKQAEALFNRADTNKDGLMSQDEFLVAMQREAKHFVEELKKQKKPVPAEYTAIASSKVKKSK